MLITAPFDPRCLEDLRRLMEVETAGWGATGTCLSREEMKALLGDADAVVTEMEPVDAEMIDSAPRLRIIGCTRGTPYNVDLEAATARRIPVLYTPGRNAQAVAELTICLMVCLARMVVPAARYVQEGRWGGERELTYVKFRGWELQGKVLGLVGLGAIGRRVAAVARALGMRVLGYDPYVPDELWTETGVERWDLEAMLPQVDFLSIHCDLTPQTRGMIGEARLALLPRRAYLINTSRGAVVDELALARALREGRLAGAALDVFTEEPLPAGHPLVGLPNCLLTPHIGGATHDVVRTHSRMIAEDLERWYRGEMPLRVANPEVYGRGP